MVRTVNIGNLKVGGRHPIRIKGMIKSPLSKLGEVVGEVKRLEKEGAEAIRVAVCDEKAAGVIRQLKKHSKLPFVADVHFNYRVALKAINEGFQGVRLNPLNIYKKKEVREVVRAAGKAKVSIRIGVNSGGFRKTFSSEKALAEEMVRRAADYIKIFEKDGFFDIMVSLKASTVKTTILANRIFSQKFSYPLHLGITATGPFGEAVVKSSIGIGRLLSEGIGSIIRVSLTAPSFWEIRIAKYILQALGIRSFGPQIISCPTCSRCEVDLIKIVEKFKKELERKKFKKPLSIALMGCVVNGPGEAHQADIGVAFGKSKAAIFRKNKILGYSTQDKIVKDLFKKIRQT